MAKSKGKKDNSMPVSEIPEVQAFEEVKRRLEAFKEANPEFFKFLSELSEEFNNKLEAATMATKSKQVSCGDFVLYQWATSYNAELLYQALGHEKFLSVGGMVKTVTDYSVDKARIQSSINSGVVPKDIAEAAVTKSPRFHKPDKLIVP